MAAEPVSAMICDKKWRLYESCLIKSIRRSLPDDAVYWASILWRLGKTERIWRRLLLHLSEDIGLADRYLPAQIHALYCNWQLLQEPSAESCYDSVYSDCYPLVHAVLLLATASKSRAVDHALLCHFHGAITEHREPPDYAIDHHSPAGRRLGRDLAHYWNVAGAILGLDTLAFAALLEKWEQTAYAKLSEPR